MAQRDPVWHDDHEVRGRILHTVRVPSNFERIAMWRVRSALVAELGDAHDMPVTPAIHRHLIPW